MGTKRNEYLDKVIGYVRNKEAKHFVARELQHHLDQEKKYLKDSGLEDSAAEEKAILQMGSAERLGHEMNKLHRPKVDWIMIGLVLVISLIGILPILHMEEAYYKGDEFLVRKVFYLAVGAVISLSLMLFNYKHLQKLKWWIYCLTSLILIAVAIFPNQYINGEGYFVILSFPIDSTVALTSLVLCWVIFLGGTRKKIWWTLPFLFVSISSLFIIPSITAAFVFVLTITVLLWFRYKENRKHMVLGYGIITIIVGFMLSTADLKPYQYERISAFLHPDEYKRTSGYMYIRNQELLSRGGWFGNSGDAEAIADAHSEYALTFITYFYGWIAGGILIITGLFIMYRMIRSIKSIKDPFGRIIIIGGVTLFATQFLYNIGMILGFLPLTGMSLPFVSYGLNPTIQVSVVVGLFLSVYRRKNLVYVDAENVHVKN
ncbi:FtsW/RodA/SpoVE family cell cycle protein [Bacillus sp. KH172YL63]|uniref:FtsW/RodA/SpoVE family cell cycle protein n=1 Tax=Bacillus sp. KH172YL63 TaxID=2709784 RepID=UPI0013E50179|nr:FtsW/RodA/SpoVE family cell cycle protein [Bacillus sp. KH172YL63]BCB02551.1 cell division protein FtsW [Bacillus sp. KH172YL63]